MSLFNHGWIGLDGAPIMGKAPPSLQVNAPPGVQMTPQQYGEVAHAFKAFTDAVRFSPNPEGFHSRDRTLRDGSRVRMTANAGNFATEVWLPGTKGGQKLPHGFVVSAPWTAPRIYGRTLTGEGYTWEVKTSVVPQAGKPITGTNQLNLLGEDGEGGKSSYVPMVHQGQNTGLWRMKRAAAPAGEPGEAVPAMLRAGSTDTYVALILAKDGRVLDLKGETKHTLTPPDPLLMEAEAVQYLPGASFGNGSRAALYAWREAQLVTLGPTYYRVRTELVSLNEDAAMAAVDTSDAAFMAPAPPTMAIQNVFGPAVDTEDDAEDYLFLRLVLWTTNATPFIGDMVTNSDDGTGYLVRAVGDGIYYWGTTANKVDLEGQYSSYLQSIRWERNRVLSEPRIFGAAVKLPTQDGVEVVDIRNGSDYPSRFEFRGGYNSFVINTPPLGYFWGVGSATIRRAVLKDKRDGTADFQLTLGWTEYRMLSGTTTGLVSLRRVSTTLTKTAGVGSIPLEQMRFSSSVFPNPPIPYISGVPSTRPVPLGFYAAAQTDANVWLPGFDIDELIHASIYEAQAAPKPGPEVVLEDTPVTNTISYDLSSRYIIDYDHRARFLAAIRVDVICGGAKWRQSTTGHQGQLELEFNPKYTVKIYFEWKLGLKVGEILLTSDEASRPGFEFGIAKSDNPFFYPSTDPAYDIEYATPPEIHPPAEAMSQLKSLTRHQGVNPHLVAEDFLVGGGDESTHGIEFTDYPNGSAPSKAVTGMLYARTFKLGDLPDALWLLTATKCDAALGDSATLPKWAYMPALGETIANQRFHVELRDGEAVQWSDDIPASGSAGRPAPADRDLTLHRV